MKNSSLVLAIPVIELMYFKGDFQKLPANKTFELVIDYPLKHPALFKIKTGKSGMGLNLLLLKIGKNYEKVYQNESKYGIWGHNIGDLQLEGIEIDYKNKRITLHVSSYETKTRK